MTPTTTGQWGEWRRRCAIDKCADPTAQALAAVPHAAGVPHLGAGPGQGDGLVQPLAPGLDLVPQDAERFPGAHKAGHLIDFIQVEGAEVQNTHCFLFLL